MKGVHKTKQGYWIAKYGTKYIGNFKEKEDAEKARKEYEIAYGVPNESRRKYDLTGMTFGHLKVIGYTDTSSKSRDREVLVRNLRNNKVKKVSSGFLISGAVNGKKRWENSNEVLGVYFKKDTQKWSATIKIDRKSYWLGSFDTKQQAIEARLKAQEDYQKFGKLPIPKSELRQLPKNISQTPSGTFRVRFQKNGIKRRKNFKTLTEAEEYLEKYNKTKGED